MTRIDEALRRTRASQQDSQPAAQEGGQQVDHVDDPWQLSDEPIAARTSSSGTVSLASEPSVVALGGALPHIAAEKLLVERTALPQAAVEQYRRLAANLHHAQMDRGIKSVMVASALAGEGKSLTASNLALTLSQSYQRRVLLVDADLRRPSLHMVFQMPETAGLSDGLFGNERKLPVVQLSSLLTLLPAGRPTPDPMAALISNRMRQVLAEAREAFDWVVVDTPPLAFLTDASLLAAMVDATVLVVRAATTPLAATQKAIGTVGKEHVIGVVLNAAEPQDQGSYFSRYSSYYGRH